MTKTMMKFGFVAATTLAAMSSQAQVSFGVKGGINLSNVAATNAAGVAIEDVYSNGLGFMGGGTVEMGLGPIAVIADVLYTQRVIKYTVGTTENSRVTSDITVPVQAKFSIIPLLFVSGGAYYSHGIGNIKFKNSDGDLTGESEYGVTNSSKSGSYGLVAGLGTQIPLGAFSLTGEARYSYGISNSTFEPSAEQSTKGRSIDILVGMKF